MKTCTGCGKEKPDEEFGAKVRGYLRARCRSCRAAENKDYRERRAALRDPYSRVLVEPLKVLARTPWARGYGTRIREALRSA